MKSGLVKWASGFVCEGFYLLNGLVHGWINWVVVELWTGWGYVFRAVYCP